MGCANGKKPGRRLLAVSLLIYGGLGRPAFARVKANFSATAQGKFAQHTQSPGGPAAERLDIKVLQNIKLSPEWSISAGGKAWFDNAFNAQPKIYPEQVRRLDSSEVRLEEAYLEYKSGPALLRLGNQQVVWGETFGNLYADIINPRDLREGYLLDASTSRRSVPMAFAKLVFGDFSIEAVGIPKPQFHVIPLPGSDFVPLPKKFAGFNSVSVQRELTANADPEAGGRISYRHDKLDTSIFYFNYYDRYPFYLTAPGAAAGELKLRESHTRLQTTAFSAAFDYESYIGRLELVHNTNRQLPVSASTSGVAYVITDEEIAIASLDLPPWQKITATAQVSTSYYAVDSVYLMRLRQQTLGSLHLMVSVFDSSNLELIASRSASDEGMRLFGEFMTPISSDLELRVGFDSYSGPTYAEYGRIGGASRVFISLKGYFNGFRP